MFKLLIILDQIIDVDVSDRGPATDGYALVWDDSAGNVVLTSISGGETNTASSAGSGTSVYYQKVGVDLQFNGVKSENSLLTVSLDGTSHDIELTVNNNLFTIAGEVTGTLAASVVSQISGKDIDAVAPVMNDEILKFKTASGKIEWDAESTTPEAEYDGVFYARKTTNLTVTTSWQNVGWNSHVKYDTDEYTHSTSSSPEEITLDQASGYNIDIKIPCEYQAGSVGLVTYFAIKVQVDTGGGFADITGEVAYGNVIHNGSSKFTVALPMYYDASAGDKIKVMIKETGGAGTVRISSAGASIRIRTISDGAI